jgi:hypothetical protein|tara:strand:+ start:6402 stop:6794 length:393 start_codon:yes stop_codon:yes gene_type:complete
MLRYVLIVLVLMSVSVVRAHEMVPTYPEMKPSFMDGLQKLTMTMFNKRQEVEYYEIGVFTEEWEPLPFVSNYKVFKIPYLSTVTFDIYIRDEDKNKAEFICSQSKLRKEQLTRTAVSSRICSRVKKKVRR